MCVCVNNTWGVASKVDMAYRYTVSYMHAHIVHTCTLRNACIPTHMSIYTHDSSNCHKWKNTGDHRGHLIELVLLRRTWLRSWSWMVNVPHHERELVTCRQMTCWEEGISWRRPWDVWCQGRIAFGLSIDSPCRHEPWGFLPTVEKKNVSLTLEIQPGSSGF